ncbi:MAG: arsenic resistance N-acetyltransferase ArsN2 [Cycloclasticus sp.]|nr:arsenic resistance N-acetyltransferase ArsN2 [Cycloclasticus sp.]
MSTHMEIKAVLSNDELLKLLESCDLLVSDIALSNSLYFFGCHQNGKLVGVVGLDHFGTVALLRSLAVSVELRGSGLGRTLVQFAESEARSMGVIDLFLLTETAEQFFTKLSYQLLSRENAPLVIKNTAQFSTLCPATSSFMSKPL